MPSPFDNEPGYLDPIEANGGGTTVQAHLDVDHPLTDRRYHVVLSGDVFGELDIFSVPLANLKSLGEQLLAVHSRLAQGSDGGDTSSQS